MTLKMDKSMKKIVLSLLLILISSLAIIPVLKIYPAKASTQSWSFQDNFDYASWTGFVGAGWTSQCGSTGASVGGGILSLSAVRQNYCNPVVSWRNIPSGVSDWSVSLTGKWAGNNTGDLWLDIYTVCTACTSFHEYQWMASGYSQDFALVRFVAGPQPTTVFSSQGYQPQLNAWHTLRLDMIAGNMYMYFDGTLKGTYAEQDPNTSLVSIGTGAGYFTNNYTNDFDIIAAAQLASQSFTLSTNPSQITILSGQSTNSTLLVTSNNGFTGTVNLSATVAPSGPSVTLTQSAVSLSGGSATLTLTFRAPTSTTWEEMFSVTVTGEGGNISRSMIVKATVFLLPPHGPINIIGNAGFTASNGVRSGSGTPSDPYIISGWDICPCGAGGASAGVQVSNTNANFAIQNVYIHDGGIPQYSIIFTNVTNGRAENSTLASPFGGMVTDRSASITFSGNMVSVAQEFVGQHEVEDVCITITSSTNIIVFGNTFSPCPAGVSYIANSTEVKMTNNNGSDPMIQQTIIFDGTTLTLSGSFMANTTAKTVNGTLSVTVKNSATGETIISKTFSISITYGSDSTARFVVSVPTSISWIASECAVYTTTNQASCTVSRDPDVNHDGAINILDLAQIAFAYGSANGDNRYNASGDLNADGLINILDLALAAFDYQQPVFS